MRAQKMNTGGGAPRCPRPLGFQGAFEATDKGTRLEGLAKETGRAAGAGLRFKTWVVTRGNHDDRDQALRRRQVLLEFDATHARHLDVRNDAGKGLGLSAAEELLGGGEAAGIVTGRANQCQDRSAHGLIVVYDADQRFRWHPVPFL